jgi:hypothetical protein
VRFALIFSLLLVASCSSGENLAASDQAVTRFHDQFNASAFDQAYTESDTAMKTAMTQPNFDKFLRWIHTRLGNFRGGRRTGWTVNYNTAGTYTTVQYESQFDRGTATETFVLANTGGNARMVNVHWDSPLLIPG